MNNKIIIAGGRGQLGTLLIPALLAHGYEVVILSRRTKTGGAIPVIEWNGRTLGAWVKQLEGTLAVINLAGRSVNCRYTRRNRRKMMASRLDSTCILGVAIGQCQQPPNVWINSSTATIYTHSYDRAMDETAGTIGPTAAAKDAFSIEIATAWEQTFFEAATPRTRKVALRSAIVLSNQPGNMLAILRRLVRLGLGGRMADGRQYVSWIHAADFYRAILFLLQREDLAGVFNLASPHPMTNAEMMALLRRHFGRRFGLPALRWMLEVGAFFLRTETELVLKSRRVVPRRLREAGFEFLFPELEQAVNELLGAPAEKRSH